MKRVFIMFLCFFISLIFVPKSVVAYNIEYQGASEWAFGELDRAVELGLMTDKIKNNLSEKITREEFAEIVIKFYELYTKETATSGNATFKDTDNPEILKAKNLGLVTGTGDNQFYPNTRITRQEMMVIILRTLKVLKPDADYSLYSSQKFRDDHKIDDWAKEGVYYCAQAGIVVGTGYDNMFDTYIDSTREQAVVICLRAYDYFLLYDSYLEE
jgi:hypothetical protein